MVPVVSTTTSLRYFGVMCNYAAGATRTTGLPNRWPTSFPMPSGPSIWPTLATPTKQKTGETFPLHTLPTMSGGGLYRAWPQTSRTRQCLPVQDLKKTRTFYKNLFGLPDLQIEDEMRVSRHWLKRETRTRSRKELLRRKTWLGLKDDGPTPTLMQ